MLNFMQRKGRREEREEEEGRIILERIGELLREKEKITGAGQEEDQDSTEIRSGSDCRDQSPELSVKERESPGSKKEIKTLKSF